MTDEELERIGLKRFDMADYLETDDIILEYLKQVLADGDKDELAEALGYIARARGIRLAPQAEPIRESAA